MIFAIKIIYKDYLKNEKNQENFFREIKIHLHINDKNVIKLYNVFSDKDNIYLLLEPMIEGDLFNIVRKHHHLSEKNVSKIVLNVCKGVRALHEKEIFHRDLKL